MREYSWTEIVLIGALFEAAARHQATGKLLEGDAALSIATILFRLGVPLQVNGSVIAREEEIAERLPSPSAEPPRPEQVPTVGWRGEA